MGQILELVIDSTNILDPSLAGYNCEIDEEESPTAPIYSRGNFCYSFRFIKGNESKCFRIWQNPLRVRENNLDKRLNTISQYLKTNRSQMPYFVDFEYLPKALANVGDDKYPEYPGIRMEWINGSTLGDYLKEGHTGQNSPPSRKDIAKLAEDFLQMCNVFKKHDIAHGDLSSENIMIDQNGQIRLIDYDSIYVPGLGNRATQTTPGVAGFQHYKRLHPETALYAGPKDDYFSQQIIYLSLLAMANSETIYQKRFDFVGKELLFAGVELESVQAFENSRAYKLIKKEFASGSIECKLLNELSKSISGPLSDVKSIVDFFVEQPKNVEQKAETPRPLTPPIEVITEALTKFYEMHPNISDAQMKQIFQENLHRPMNSVEEKIWENLKLNRWLAKFIDEYKIEPPSTPAAHISSVESGETKPSKSTTKSETNNIPKLAKFCHKCGKEYISDTAKFCIKCGAVRLKFKTN